MTKKEITFEYLVNKGQRLLNSSGNPVRTNSEYSHWTKDVSRWLEDKYPDIGVSAEWSGLGSPTLVIGNAYYDSPENWIDFKRLISARLTWLGKTVRDLALHQSSPEEDVSNDTAEYSNKVFIVHGHEEALREATARFVERLGLEAVILHEQANKGQTIIEKFESNSSVAFAIVLLSGDDAGALKSDIPNNLNLRARQNVIFELGYFFGKLGRHKVCAVHQQGVELPSDYSGIVYIPFDESGAWKYQVAKEIKKAGIAIDLNKTIS